MRASKPPLPQDHLRELCWEIGTKFPISAKETHVHFSFVHPHLGFIHWSLTTSDIDTLQSSLGEAAKDWSLCLRIYDVTCIEFNGHNAHSITDIEVNGLQGNYYQNIQNLDKNYIVEIGFRLTNGEWYSLSRSEAVYFDRDGSSNNPQLNGLFVGKEFNRILSVGNIFDAAVYQRMRREGSEYSPENPIKVCTLFIDDENKDFSETLSKISENIRDFGCEQTPVAIQSSEEAFKTIETLNAFIQALVKKESLAFLKKHKTNNFNLIECHDWISGLLGIEIGKKLKLPVSVFFHSTEHARTGGKELSPISECICKWETEVCKNADLLIASNSGVHQQLIEQYKTSEQKTVIIADCIKNKEEETRSFDAGEVKISLGLHPEGPLGFYCSEISHACGADLLVGALDHAFSKHETAQIVIAGEGPLKGELEAKIHHSGHAHRCKFVGDLPSDRFEQILNASQFVIIPARTWQDEGLAQSAMNNGIPVLATHQSHINGIQHGENGLMTYDNPGSIVWGLMEMYHNMASSSSVPSFHHPREERPPSYEQCATQLFICFENLLNEFKNV